MLCTFSETLVNPQYQNSCKNIVPETFDDENSKTESGNDGELFWNNQVDLLCSSF